MNRMLRIAGTFACTATLVGCASIAAGPSSQATRTGISGSWATDYATLEAVGRDSSAVVIGTVEGPQKVLPSADEEESSKIPATLSTIRVERVLSGKSPGMTFVLTELGSPGLPVEGVEVLKPGQRYVLFVKPFYFHPGQSTGQYVTTAPNARYVMGADDELQAVTREGRLPQGITLGALETAIRQ